MPKTALLLMDFQNVIVSRYNDNADFIDRVRTVKKAARDAGMLIVYVVVKFRPDFPDVSPHNKAFVGLKAGAFPITEGDASSDIYAALAPDANDLVVTKRRVGAFSGSDLEVVLRSQEITRIVLTGISTSGVVLSTLRLAADMDYEVTVLSDCCYDKDEEVHRVLTQKVFPFQADVETAEEWMERLKF